MGLSAPASGLLVGGTAIALSGTGFAPGVTVTIGGTVCTLIVRVSDILITALTPLGGGLGAADILVTNLDGQTSGVSGNGKYAYT